MDTAGRIDKFRQRYASKTPVDAGVARVRERARTGAVWRCRRERQLRLPFSFRSARTHRADAASRPSAMPTQAPADADSEQGSALSPSGPYRALKQFGLVVLCATWALLGTFGHDPWKTEDATAFGIAYEMMQRGDVAGSAPRRRTVRRPAAARLRRGGARPPRAFSPLLPMPDAARLAAALVLALTMLLLAATRGGALRPRLPLAGGAALHRLGRTVGPRAPALARAGPDARRRGGALRLRARAAATRSPAARCSGLGVAVAFLSRGFLGPALARTHRARAAGRVPELAHAPLRADRRRRARDRRCRSAARGRWRSTRARRSTCTPGGRCSRIGDYFAPLADHASADPLVPAEEPAVVRVAGAAARALDALDARPRLQRRPRDARRAASGHACARDGRVPWW